MLNASVQHSPPIRACAEAAILDGGEQRQAQLVANLPAFKTGRRTVLLSMEGAKHGIRSQG